jgi:energy-coupling factor transport system substrate-specific component
MKSTSSKPSVRDLVLIGVLTTVMIAIETIVSMALMPMMWLSFIVGNGITAAFMALVYMLLAFKVGKRGTFFLIFVLRGLFYSLMGFPSVFIIMLPAGLAGELLLSPPEVYRNPLRVSLAWTISSAIYALHGPIILWIFGLQSAESMGFSAEQIAFIQIHLFNPLSVGLIALFGAVGAGLGCWFGWGILKKHFIKSGLVQASS